MTVPVSQAAPQVSPAALAQKVGAVLAKRRSGRGDGAPAPVVLIRADPKWPYDTELTLPDGERATVVPCVSPLAVWEQVSDHTSRPTERPLVILTDLDEAAVGDAVIGQVHRHRLFEIEPWDVVMSSFGATQLDPRLRDEKWAGAALLNAMPAAGWPPLPGAVLNRDDALRCLAVVRLGMAEIEVRAEDLDAAALLRWSTLPDAAARVAALHPDEKQGLIRWLIGLAGQAAEVLFTAVDAGHTSEALALGLVCDCVWSPGAAALSDLGKGQVGGYLHTKLTDDAARAFDNVAKDVVTAMMQPADDRNPRAAVERRAAHTALEKAEDFLRMFGAEKAAAHSGILQSGFEHHIRAAGAALAASVPVSTSDSVAALADALARLQTHRLRDSHRVERVEMALRLVRWLATEAGTVPSVADGVRSQVDDWGWVDVAVTHVWDGEDADPGLQAAYRELLAVVARRQRALDEAFAGRLAAWTSAGTPPKGVLTVEGLLATVVAPVVRTDDCPVLLVVLDGMSVGVANQLADELDKNHWVEYGPVAGKQERHRRGVVAALPTMTEVSRTSLLAGKLRRGRAADESRVFESHEMWGAKKAKLFHKRAVRGGAGEVLSGGVTEALEDPDTLVAVVINTIDDALGPGREGEDSNWRIEHVGQLRTLLDRARYHGRAVIITSDHGHVLDHGSIHPRDTGALSARHRATGPPPGDGEVLLAGPRVGTDAGQVVALWDRAVRYKQYRAGHHGGASLAEVVIPLLAFVSFGAAVPAGWAALAHRKPDWWTATAAPRQLSEAAAPARPVPAPRQPRRTTTPDDAATLFELSSPVAPEPPAAAPKVSLVDALLASEMFAAQQEMTARRLPKAKIVNAVTALLDAGNQLPVAVLAERAGEPAVRGPGFVTTLERIFNVDSFPVLSTLDEGRTVQLNVKLLREQFELPKESR